MAQIYTIDGYWLSKEAFSLRYFLFMPNKSSGSFIKMVKKTLLELAVPASSNILIGVSGGVDSMVLLTVMKDLGYNISVAHVNFHLRGNESDNDASLVKNWCNENKIPFFQHDADTHSYADQNNLNIQSAAREIRYQWWEAMANEKSFDFVATAHHRDDAIETFFINLLRGTGIKGLSGIPIRRDLYIRPLIEVSRAEIEEFATLNNTPFRTDRSNETDDYHRNRIRHHLIPVVREFAVDPDTLMEHSLNRIRTEWNAWEFYYQKWIKENIISEGENFRIHVVRVDQPFFLRWLEEKGIPWPLGFDYVNSTLSNTGKVLEYGIYRLSRTGDGFYLEKNETFELILIDKPGMYDLGNMKFSIEHVSQSEFQTSKDSFTEFISVESFQWPLIIREINPGDHFQPLGMQGQTKKLQDFLVDLKLENFEKRQTRVLTSGDKIIWVIGKRLDERFKVGKESNEVYKLTCSQKVISQS
ncbi:MAG TPA: tRNA lysidine(34) synthetase TilS [Saprospiraceae bacterium]|nr:tRNA lysidine(34) synthetase TilS [Saprospiraceae bacterium]